MHFHTFVGYFPQRLSLWRCGFLGAKVRLQKAPGGKGQNLAERHHAIHICRSEDAAKRDMMSPSCSLSSAPCINNFNLPGHNHSFPSTAMPPIVLSRPQLAQPPSATTPTASISNQPDPSIGFQPLGSSPQLLLEHVHPSSSTTVGLSVWNFHFKRKAKCCHNLLALPQHQHTSFLCPDVSDRIALSFFFSCAGAEGELKD